MKIFKKTPVCAVIIFVILLGLAAAPAISMSYDQLVADDLAKLSGLSSDTVLQIHNVTDDWGQVKENIFVYRDIVNQLLELNSKSDKVYSAIAQYPPEELLAVIEFINKNKLSYEHFESILEEYATGKDLSTVLDSNQFQDLKVYQPATKDQIRTWRTQGYSVDDILTADMIAIEKDLDIEELINMKTTETTWDTIAEKAGYEFQESEPVSLSVDKGDGLEAFTGKDYNAVVNDINAKADNNKNQLKQKTAQDIGINAEQMQVYNERGFNQYEVKNAYQLAKASGVTAEEVLQFKEAGHSWEETITQFNKPERKVTE